MEKRHEITFILATVTTLGVTIWCYSQGLSGGFVFDDDANIRKNSALLIDSLSFAELWKDAWSGQSSRLGRPVSMLSFALNVYATGLDPYYFKATNLVIHLLTGGSLGILAYLLISAGYTQSIRRYARWWHNV